MVRAGEAHLRAIASIYNEAVLNSTATFDTEPKTIVERRQWLVSHGDTHPVLVALDDRDEVLGWGSLSPYSDRLAYQRTVEDSLYVRADVRGQGLGRLLLDQLLRAGAAGGYHSVIAKVVDGNEASLAVHRKAGFFDVGTMHEVGYKFDRWLDVTLLERLLRGE